MRACARATPPTSASNAHRGVMRSSSAHLSTLPPDGPTPPVESLTTASPCSVGSARGRRGMVDLSRGEKCRAPQ